MGTGTRRRQLMSEVRVCPGPAAPNSSEAPLLVIVQEL